MILWSLQVQAAPSLEDRVQASLWGLAYGDALGLATESWTETHIRQVFGSHQDLKTPLPLAKIWRIAGEKTLLRSRILGFTSDDTQQAMGLLLVFLQHPEWGVPALTDWGHLVAAGQKAKAWRGTGPRFRQAAKTLGLGTSYYQSGSESAGMGAAMRVAPLGALAALSRYKAAAIQDAVVTSSAVTHSDLRAVAFSAAVAWTAEKLAVGWPMVQIRQELPSHVALIERQWAARTDWNVTSRETETFSSALLKLFRDFPLTREEVSQKVQTIGKSYLPDRQNKTCHPNDGFVKLGGLHALGLALLDHVDPLEVLRYVVNIGDDTDTVGAIAGGLLGARFGADWIPTTELFDEDRIKRYTNAMVSGSQPETAQRFLAAEQALTRKERQFQKHLKDQACRGIFNRY